MSDLCELCDTPTNRGCGKCHLVYYCSENCQQKHWEDHQDECEEFEIINAQFESDVQEINALFTRRQPTRRQLRRAKRRAVRRKLKNWKKSGKLKSTEKKLEKEKKKKKKRYKFKKTRDY